MNSFTARFRLPSATVLGLSLLAGSIVASSLIPVADAATARDRYVEVKAVEGTVTSGGRPLQVGDRLKVNGPGLKTGRGASAQLAIDDGIGTIDVAEETDMNVRDLSVLGDGSKTTQLFLAQGQAKAKVRPFTNRNSGLSIRTRSGVAGVRGTEFGVVMTPTGEMRVSALNGIVEVSALDKIETLLGGYSSVIFPGEAPTPPRLTLERVAISLELLTGAEAGQVRVNAMMNPVNFVFLNNEAATLDRQGQLNTVVPIPEDRRLKLVIRSPLGEEQVYELKVPEALPLN